jgi:hypothetical protein
MNVYEASVYLAYYKLSTYLFGVYVPTTACGSWMLYYVPIYDDDVSHVHIPSCPKCLVAKTAEAAEEAQRLAKHRARMLSARKK